MQISNDIQNQTIPWKRYIVIPYCNILSKVFCGLIDEKYVKSSNGIVDFSKTRTIEMSLRILASEYLLSILNKYAFTVSNKARPIYPTLIIIPSSSSIRLCDEPIYSVSPEYASLQIDQIKFEYFSNKLLENISSFHPDIIGIIEVLSNNIKTIWIDETYSFIKQLLFTHFIPEESCEILDKGVFIKDVYDYDISNNSVEKFKIEILSKQHILYRAVESKLIY